MVFVWCGGGTHGMAHVCRSEDSLVESPLSRLYLCSKGQVCVARTWASKTTSLVCKIIFKFQLLSCIVFLFYTFPW